MARRRVRQYNRRQQTYAGRNPDYIQGSVVKKLDERGTAQRKPVHNEPAQRRPQAERARRQMEHAARKNRERARHMNLGYVLFMSVTLSLIGVMLIGYIGLQSDITSRVKNIARLESTLNTLKLKNDEEYNRIESSENLEEIKRIAIQELGMKYAEEGQVITFSGEGSDYIRQVADIPE